MREITLHMKTIGGDHAIYDQNYEYKYRTFPCIAPIAIAIGEKMNIAIEKKLRPFTWREWEPNIDSDYLRAWEYLTFLRDFNLLSNLIFSWEDLR